MGLYELLNIKKENLYRKNYKVPETWTSITYR